MAEDLTIEILRGIRAATEKTAEGLAELTVETRKDSAALRREMSQHRDELVRHVTSVEMRVSTQLTDLRGTLQDMAEAFKDAALVLPRVVKCEVEIEMLKRRLPDA